VADLYIGTSGYSYDDWVDPIHPKEIKKTDWLHFYAHDLGFNTTEINYTYYRMPAARTLAAMAKKVPAGFVFIVKATQEITHLREDTQGLFAEFKKALQPLIDEDKFGCVLAQFPNSFHNTPENQDYLRNFGERMGDVPVVVEFRNREWITDEVFDLLRENRLGFCCVDQPQFESLIPPIAVATSEVGYVRFHGRNYRKWWKHEHAYERYDYSYSDEELQEWSSKIEKLEDETERMFAFANNHFQGQAVSTAKQLKMLLGQNQS
jgi:uncharacterized protein YecE (DUF72 family)